MILQLNPPIPCEPPHDANQVRTNMKGPMLDAKVYALEQIVNQIEKAFLFGTAFAAERDAKD